MTEPAAKRTALYRLLDGGGQSLYIGITEDPEGRWKGHAATKPWWREVVRKELQWYPSRPLAEAAEVQAIRTERTPYNVDDSPWASRARDLDVDELQSGNLVANIRDVVRRVNGGEMLWVVDRKWQRSRQAAIVPIELGHLIRQVGGPDVAAGLLAKHLAEQKS